MPTKVVSVNHQIVDPVITPSTVTAASMKLAGPSARLPKPANKAVNPNSVAGLVIVSAKVDAIDLKSDLLPFSRGGPSASRNRDTSERKICRPKPSSMTQI